MAQYIVRQVPARRRGAHADADPREIRAAGTLEDAAHPVVGAWPAAGPDAYLTEGQVDIIHDDQHFLGPELEPVQRFGHAQAALIHKGLRLDQDHLLPLHGSFADEGFALELFERDIP